MNDIILTQDGTLPLTTENEIVNLLSEIKKLETMQEALKERLKEEMLKWGYVKIETPKVLINYVSPTTKETFKTKDFKKDHPDLYDEYVSISNVKEYVKVKLK